MPPIENLLAFAAAAAILIAVPGPSVLFVIGRSLALGRRGGLLSVLGNALGMLGQLALVVVGVGAIVAQSVVLFTIVKYLGAAYLIYLGVQAIRHGRESGQRAALHARALTDAGGIPHRERSGVRILWEGFLVGITNPKAIVFFVAVLPQFVDYRAGAVPTQLAVLGVVFAVIALVFDGAWALAAGTARRWFATRPRRVAQLSMAGGAMMIGLGAWVALFGDRAARPATP